MNLLQGIYITNKIVIRIIILFIQFIRFFDNFLRKYIFIITYLFFIIFLLYFYKIRNLINIDSGMTSVECINFIKNTLKMQKNNEFSQILLHFFIS